MVAAVPPLSVDGVSVKRETLRVPLRSMDVTPFPHYYQDIRLPRQPQDSSWFCQLCLLTPRRRTAWDLPSSRLCLDDVPRSQTPVDPTEPWPLAPAVSPSVLHTTSASTMTAISGLYPFTLTHCSPSLPCVRFAPTVTDDNATLSTWCLTKASRARTFT